MTQGRQTAGIRRSQQFDATSLLLLEGSAVSAGFNDDAKEQVRHAVDIVELVGEHIQLQKKRPDVPRPLSLA